MIMDSDGSEDEDTVFSSSIRPSSSLPLRLHLLTFLSAIGGFLFGYDTGVISGAMLLLRQEFSLSEVWQEVIVSSTVMSACVASLGAGTLADTWGRRPTVLLASALFSVGSVVLAAAAGPWSLLLGRLIVGAGVGLASHTVPLYISECSPTTSRGVLLTMNNVAITGGQLAAALLCGVMSSVEHGWRHMLGLAVIPAAIQLVGFVMMPESPRYLVMKQRVEEAERELGSLRGAHHQLRDELEDMMVSVRTAGDQSSWGSVWQSSSARLSVSLGCLLQATQQLAGINTVMYYSASILVMAGMSDTASIWLASLTAAINFLFTMVGVVAICKMTRRKLLLTSIAIVSVALVLIAISFQFVSRGAGSVLAVLSLCLYLAGFAPGLGTLPWVINSEMHPSWCRARAVSMATATNWATNMIVSASFLSLVSSLGRSTTFVVYAVLTTVCGVTLASWLPETQGVSLEETETLFTSSVNDTSRYSLVSREED